MLLKDIPWKNEGADYKAWRPTGYTAVIYRNGLYNIIRHAPDDPMNYSGSSCGRWEGLDAVSAQAILFYAFPEY